MMVIKPKHVGAVLMSILILFLRQLTCASVVKQKSLILCEYSTAGVILRIYGQFLLSCTAICRYQTEVQPVPRSTADVTRLQLSCSYRTETQISQFTLNISQGVSFVLHLLCFLNFSETVAL
jgi:hypothetical protein